MHTQPASTRLSANQEIIVHSLGEVRSFLDELKHGTGWVVEKVRAVNRWWRTPSDENDLAEIGLAHEQWQGALYSIDYLRNMLPAKRAGLLDAEQLEEIKIATRKLEAMGLTPPPDTPEWKWPNHYERLYPHVENNGIEAAKKERDSWYE